MPSTMPQSHFYAKVRHGLPALLAQWRRLGHGDADQLALILAETARVVRLGTPSTTPDGATLDAWCRPENRDALPLWAACTATFLLVQMPARPQPASETEACAWAYCWLRQRRFDSLEAARSALPAHLRDRLAAPLGAAWADRQGLRLV